MNAQDLSAMSAAEWLTLLSPHLRQLPDSPVVALGVVQGADSGEDWALHVCASTHFLRAVCRAHLSGSAALGRTLQNLDYGWRPHLARSRGGRDGIFAVSRDFTPRNAMMRMCFERGLDSAAGAAALAAIGATPKDMTAVRIVSHSMRVLAFVRSDGAHTHQLLLWGVDRNVRG